MTKTLQVALGERSYPIYIGPGLLSDPQAFRAHLPGRQLMIVSNETVAPLYLDPLREALAGHVLEQVILPDGEGHKTLAAWEAILDGLLTARFARDCAILALGGGVVGDMAGFAAACYQRGVAYIQVPTTLLAQVDSSVGGKTGVNHRLGKNMIGAFHQPRAVIADIDTLTTLADRELSAGIAEVIKYGLIRDGELFHWLEHNMEALLARDADALTHAIEHSCRNKAEIVAADELESGQRALLNLGHTFGHAIETGMGYGSWLHGEAVAAGICMAADLSLRMGWLDDALVRRIRDLLAAARLPTSPPRELEPERFRLLMSVDKKVKDGRPRLVLLQGIGKALVTADFDQTALERTLRNP